MSSGVSAVIIAFLLCTSRSAVSDPAPALQPTPVAAMPSDAARHARRVQCLREARAKKIVGAHRTAFVKSCLARP